MPGSDPHSDPPAVAHTLRDLVESLEYDDGKLLIHDPNTAPPSGTTDRAPLQVRALNNVAVEIQADPDSGGAGNIQWYEKDEGNHIGSLTFDGNAADGTDQLGFSVYINNQGTDVNDVLKAFEIGGGSTNWGEAYIRHSPRMRFRNHPDGNDGRVVLWLEPQDAEYSEIRFSDDGGDTNMWTVHHETPDNTLSLYNYATGEGALFAQPDGTVDIRTGTGGWETPSVVSSNNVTGDPADTVDGDDQTSCVIDGNGYIIYGFSAPEVSQMRVTFADADGEKDIMLTPHDGSRDQIARTTLNGLNGPSDYYFSVDGYTDDIGIGNFLNGQNETFEVHNVEVYRPSYQTQSVPRS